MIYKAPKSQKESERKSANVHARSSISFYAHEVAFILNSTQCSFAGICFFFADVLNSKQQCQTLEFCQSKPSSCLKSDARY